MALTGPKKTQMMAVGGMLVIAVAAIAACQQGGLCILDDGYGRPAREGQGADNAAKAVDAATHRCIGIFTESVVGGVANGDVKTTIQSGSFKFKNSAAGDLIGVTEIGRRCYIVDDETVAKTSPNATRAVAGIVQEIDADGGVWVAVSPTIAGLAAA
jgi:hypothetical protein